MAIQLSMKKFFTGIFLFATVLCMLPGVSHGSAGTLLTAPPNDLNLIGHWTFDPNHVSGKTVYDTSTSANNGTSHNTPILSNAELSTAMSFNGTSDYIDPASTPAWGTQTFSIWIYQTTAQPDYAHIFGSFDGNTSFPYTYGNGIMENTANAVSCIAAQNDSNWYTNLTATISLNQWHMVTCTITGMGSGQTGKLYVDGVLKATYTGTAANWGYPFAIGAGAGNGNHSWFFKGKLDDARLYTRVLSAQEIAQLYSAGLHDISSATGVGTSPTTLLRNGLVGYWTFDGVNTNWLKNKTSDVSGNGNTGTLVGMSTTTSPVLGRFGQAFSFNGSGQYVNVGNLGVSGAATLAMWIKPSQLTGDDRLIGQLSGATNQQGALSIGVSGNSGALMVWAGINPWHALTPTGTFATNNWYFVVVVYSGGNATAYVNGVEKLTAAANFNFSGVSAGIGAKFLGTNGNTFSGVMDDVRAYNRALSATEVQQLYNSGAPGHGVTIDTAPMGGNLSNGLVGYWPLDGNTTSWLTDTTQDISGNGNTGSLINMSTTTSPVMGKMGQALSFPGNGYIQAKTSTGSPTTGDGTWSFWLNPTSNASILGIFDSNPGNPGALQIRYNTSKKIAVGIGGAVYPTQTAGTINTNIWTFFTLVKSGSVYTSYINGSFDSTLFTNAKTLVANAYIGKENESGSNIYWQGSIDDFRIYSRALSASEITQLYNLGH